MFAVDRVMLGAQRLLRSAVIVDRAAQHDAEAAVDRAFGNLFHELVHIERRRDAAGHVFEHGKLRQIVHLALGEVRLHRKAVLVQPLMQRLVVRKRAQKRHGGMRVRVLEARQQQIAAAVDLAVERGRLGAVRIAHQRDAIALYPKFALDDPCVRRVERKNARIVQPQIHVVSPS